MKHRLAHLWILFALLFTCSASAQLTPGTVTAEAARTDGSNLNTNAKRKAFAASLGLPFLNLRDYGAKGDAFRYDTASMTSGSATLTVTGATFTSAIIGKHARLQGGGVHQTETFTGAGAISGGQNLTLSVAITAAGMTGSPLTIPPVPVANGDATATWVSKVVYALRNARAFRVLYSVDYTGGQTSFTVRRKTQSANDSTLAITVSLGAGTTNASLPITSANGSSGVAAPAELVTSVSGFTNATTLTLANVAPGTYTNATVFIGTDDTAAVQAWLNDLNAGLGGRRGYAPKGDGGGGYLCNATGYDEITIFGDGGGMIHQFDTPPSWSVNSRSSCPTVFFPALSTAPVLDFDTCFGTRFENFMICGSRLSGGRKGIGMQLGDPPPATGYVGSNIRFDSVNICGFDIALSASRLVDVVANTSNFTDSRICLYAPQNWDTSVLNGCIVGGIDVEWCAWLDGAKNIVIHGGDWNWAEHVAFLSTSDVSISTINCELIQGSHFEQVSGTLNIGHIKTLNATGPLIDATGPTVGTFIGTTNLHGFGPAYWNGLPVLYRSAGTEYPERLPRGGVILRYSSTALTTFQQAEWTDYLYRLPGPSKRAALFKDSFGGGLNSGFTQIGELGWVVDNITGPTGGTPGSGAGPWVRFINPGNAGLGVAECFKGDTTSTNEFRFCLPSKLMLASATTFQMHWSMYVEDEANTRIRWGLYSKDNTLDMLPLHGIGFHCDRSTPDATVFAEVIDNGTLTRIDTGMPYTGLGTMKEYVIRKDATGIYLGIRQNSAQTPAAIVPMIRHSVTAAPSIDYLTPSAYIGVSATTYPQVYTDDFLLEAVQP